MIKSKIWIAALALVSTLIICSKSHTDVFERKERLSEYNFFEGELKSLTPKPGVIQYTLNTPLFSNYAEKLRFIKIPEGMSAKYNDSAVFDFPNGTVLIKNFYYPNDFRDPAKGRRIIETRLLVNMESGWEAIPYIWNEEQTEAFYDPAGDVASISYIDGKGKSIKSKYVIPNKNQCKGCHTRGSVMVPIGPSARQLNHDDQLQRFQSLGIVSGLPASEFIPRLAIWNDEKSGSLNSRARAYLDANCGHCHSRFGPASTSGLFLSYDNLDLTHLGVNKTPVAAGRGAGDLKYDIAPGDPLKSILIFRMKTNDPAIAMPEIGREQIHKEAIDLIEAWIKKKAYQ